MSSTSRQTSAFMLALSLFAAAPASAQRVTEVRVLPNTLTLGPNQRQSVAAAAYDAKGNVVATAQFHWSSSNPEVVRVEANSSQPGLASVISVGLGVAQVQARVGSVTGSAAVQVAGAAAAAGGGTGIATVLKLEPTNVQLLPGEQITLRPLFLKNDGSLAAPTAITWNSPNAAVVTVNDQGVLLAQGEGTATVQASTPSGLQAVASVQVAKAPFAFASAMLSAGPGIDTTVPVVVPTQGNRSVSVSSLNFQSSDTTVVKVSPLGRIHTVATGRAQVLAQGFFQTRALVVQVHPAITSVSVLPRIDRGDVVVPLAGVRPFKVALYAAHDSELKNIPLAWSVKDTALAVFDTTTRTIRGKALGTTELTLLSPGPGIKPIVWPIKVVAGGLVLTPRAIGIGIRDTAALTVAYTDSTGQPISPASPTDLKWTTSDSSVAAVSAGGVVTGIGFGFAKIVAATSWGKTDTTNLFVTGELIIASTRGGTQNLYTLDRAAPGTLGPVTHDSAIEAAPAFSPDGARIAFISTKDGNPEVYVSNADGTDARRLTKTPQAEDGPVWTPDGKHIVFTSQRTGHFQIWIMNADGSDQRALTKEPATNFEPDVSPDGKSIAFTSTRDKHYDIYVMGLDGSNPHDVTKTDAADRHPRWFPDGELGYLVVQPGSSPQALAAMRRNLKSGQATTVSPTNLTLTNWAISPTGKVLALEVSALANGGVSKRVYFYTIGGTAAPLPIPQASPDEQQSGPAFRPAHHAH